MLSIIVLVAKYLPANMDGDQAYEGHAVPCLGIVMFQAEVKLVLTCLSVTSPSQSASAYMLHHNDTVCSINAFVLIIALFLQSPSYSPIHTPLAGARLQHSDQEQYGVSSALFWHFDCSNLTITQRSLRSDLSKMPWIRLRSVHAKCGFLCKMFTQNSTHVVFNMCS